jgi:hypothetical protein
VRCCYDSSFTSLTLVVHACPNNCTCSACSMELLCDDLCVIHVDIARDGSKFVDTFEWDLTVRMRDSHCAGVLILMRIPCSVSHAHTMLSLSCAYHAQSLMLPEEFSQRTCADLDLPAVFAMVRALYDVRLQCEVSVASGNGSADTHATLCLPSAAIIRILASKRCVGRCTFTA